MKAYLLDVNVLLALSWPDHHFHDRVQDWFGRHGAKGWATCPMVQAGFVRIVSNPAFSPKAVSLKDAIAALRFNTSHPAHQFWPDDVSVATGMANLGDRIVGHQQVTDAYLVELAVHHRGKLATLDRGIATWGASGAVELIG
jgi:toxin-antitoxin system PIN domain toxin